MQQFRDWEAQQMTAMRGPKQEFLTCQECGSDWMETVHAIRVDRNKINSLGQAPMAEASATVLRCVRCGELHEPPVNRVFNHPESKVYDEFLDTLQEPEEKWGGRRAKRREEANNSTDQ